jgi:hypothetical protein
MVAQRPSIFARLTSVRNASLTSPALRECCHGGLARRGVSDGATFAGQSCGLALALGDLLFAAIFGASAVSDYRGESPGFLESLPRSQLEEGTGGDTGNAHGHCASPSPQGHEQRRVSSPPQAKFGRGPSHQKILTVVLAQHHPRTSREGLGTD